MKKQLKLDEAERVYTQRSTKLPTVPVWFVVPKSNLLPTHHEIDTATFSIGNRNDLVLGGSLWPILNMTARVSFFMLQALAILS